jgi:glycosyltransferase involved in cell wall biosynthesis
MKSFRLLMVSEPGRDGVFSVVNSIIRQILERHPEITVDLAYSSRRSGESLKELIALLEERGGRTLDLNVGNAPSPADFKALLALLRFTRERSHQLVHAHSSKAGALARIAHFLTPFSSPPVLYTPHAYYGMGKFGGIKERLFDFIEALLGHIGITLCTSPDERDFALQELHLPASRLQVIDNGIDTELFAPADAQTKAEARAALSLPVSGKLLVTIGRDSPQKNYEPLYSVLETMLPGGDWNFAHAGAGAPELRARLSPVAQAHCFAFHHLDTIPLFLKAADGFVMTSRYEGLSLAMLQALSTGLPMFLTNAPGFRFLKELGFDQIIWLPDPENITPLEESLRVALQQWASQPPQISLQQRELAEHYFSQPKQIEKLVALYREIL